MVSAYIQPELAFSVFVFIMYKLLKIPL